MKVSEITSFLEQLAPLGLQEAYDNSGLLIGHGNQIVSKALITLDVTDEVVKEAIENKCQLIIAHHPLIFNSLKKINTRYGTGALIAKLIKEDVALYAIHTNLDNVMEGVNAKLAQTLGLQNIKILAPKSGTLNKLVVFCPVSHVEAIQQAMFDAGAGNIGNYNSCSFNSAGYGTFKAQEGANPYVGNIGKLHKEEELKIEVVVPSYLAQQVVAAMISAHPYEEVAYDIYPLLNEQWNIGAGMIGELETESDPEDFLKKVKKQLNASHIRHSPLIKRKVKKVAICGGSGSFLIHNAYNAKADIFITGDVKYHDFFEHAGKMTIADAGHFETEQFTKELLYDRLNGKFPNFALQISKARTNPIYFL
ncbi:MAG: Nif3-like dinuclear metal center hexameric protein [Bacteroidetes bacterium]|nr:Nif3-like dinuclear metal center hexameric protein [Bacteroidota bacterium]